MFQKHREEMFDKQKEAIKAWEELPWWKKIVKTKPVYYTIPRGFY